MNSFFVPALAGQIYAMAGMETKLHAVINKPGVYDGFSANFSGDGFSHMNFKFHGMQPGRLRQVGAEGEVLRDEAGHGRLQCSSRSPAKTFRVKYYSSVDPDALRQDPQHVRRSRRRPASRTWRPPGWARRGMSHDGRHEATLLRPGRRSGTLGSAGSGTKDAAPQHDRRSTTKPGGCGRRNDGKSRVRPCSPIRTSGSSSSAG